MKKPGDLAGDKAGNEEVWAKPPARDVFFQPSFLGDRVGSAFSVRPESSVRPSLEVPARTNDSCPFDVFKSPVSKTDDTSLASRIISADTFKFPQLVHQSDPVIDLQAQMKLSSFKNSCFCQNKEKDKEVFFMCSCKNMAHKSCMPWRSQDFGDFECTACTILSNDPLNEVKEVLLEPTIMHSCFTYRFKLKMNDFNALNSDPSLDLEIRCIKMDGEHFFEQTWPDKCDIRINGSIVKTFSPLMHNSSLKKRRDEKLTITKPIIGTNTLSFNFENVRDGKNTKVDKDPLYTFTVVLVKRLSVNELADKIIKHHSIAKEESVKLIKEKFQGSLDVKISEVKADLDCKLSLSTMVHPARGKYCSHLNCFSLKYFLKSMQSNLGRNWTCPICKRPCYKLIVDSYLEQIIIDTKKVDPNRREVFFRKDGSICLTPELEIQAELLSTGGSSKHALKHSLSKHHEKNSDPVVVVLDDEDIKLDAHHKAKRTNLKTDFAPQENRQSSNKMEDQLLGKRLQSSLPSFLEDKEFVCYLHNYTRKAPRALSEEPDNFRLKPGFSSFEANLTKRINSDVIARQIFNVFYGLVMKKKKDTEAERLKAPMKGIYQDLLSEINAFESTEKSTGSANNFKSLDVFQWVLREYKLEYQSLPYLTDKPTLDSEINSAQFS